MPGQPDNVNAAKHGRRSRRTSLVITHMAVDLRGMEGTLHKMRQGLEREARKVRGVAAGDPLGAEADGAVGMAVDSERVRVLSQRLAREAWEAGDHARAVELEKTALAMAEKRNAAIGQAMRPPDKGDPLAWLYAPQDAVCSPTAGDDAEHARAPGDARTGDVGDGTTGCGDVPGGDFDHPPAATNSPETGEV